VRLRSKVLLAQLPLAAALAAVGVISVLTVTALGNLSERVLKDNYRSVLAAQRMKESIERIDSAALFVVAGQRAKGMEQMASSRRAFEVELQVQEQNITEPGEQERTRRLGDAWRRYVSTFDRFATQPEGSAAGEMYFAELEPRFVDVKGAADDILALNQDAMVRKSEDARRYAAHTNNALTGVALVALLLGVAMSVWLTGRLLRPLESLGQAAHLVGEGDLETRASVLGNDEIAQLAREFNAMAEHLAQYRRSSLGELLQAQQASQAAIDSIPDPVVIFTTGGGIMTANQAGETLLNLGRAAGEQSPLAMIDPGVRAALERVRDHVLAGRGACVPKGFEEAVRIGTAEGDRFLLPRATPLYSEHGAVTGATVILQDVTRPRRFDELKNDLVATVAHEFRTPLTSLHMAIHLCLEGAAGPVSEQQADLLHAARQDCERLQGIVNDLLDLARLQAGKVELQRRPTTPDALIQTATDAHRAVARQRGVLLEAEVSPDAPSVVADPERLQIVLSNLLSNALRHAPEGTAVVLRAVPVPGAARFEVADQGAGVPAEHQQRIFERFFRIPGARGGGVGLGLSVAKEIVEAHGGEIGVASASGQGATFWFTVPTSGATAE
jgi:two-component system, NtrC family, sensor histidine kinase KinB